MGIILNKKIGKLSQNKNLKKEDGFNYFKIKLRFSPNNPASHASLSIRLVERSSDGNGLITVKRYKNWQSDWFELVSSFGIYELTPTGSYDQDDHVYKMKIGLETYRTIPDISYYNQADLPENPKTGEDAVKGRVTLGQRRYTSVTSLDGAPRVTLVFDYDNVDFFNTLFSAYYFRAYIKIKEGLVSSINRDLYGFLSNDSLSISEIK